MIKNTKIPCYEEDLEVCTQNKDDGFNTDNEENPSCEENLESQLMLFQKTIIIYQLKQQQIAKTKSVSWTKLDDMINDELEQICEVIYEEGLKVVIV